MVTKGYRKGVYDRVTEGTRDACSVRERNHLGFDFHEPRWSRLFWRGASGACDSGQYKDQYSQDCRPGKPPENMPYHDAHRSNSSARGKLRMNRRRAPVEATSRKQPTGGRLYAESQNERKRFMVQLPCGTSVAIALRSEGLVQQNAGDGAHFARTISRAEGLQRRARFCPSLPAEGGKRCRVFR